MGMSNEWNANSRAGDSPDQWDHESYKPKTKGQLGIVGTFVDVANEATSVNSKSGHVGSGEDKAGV